MNIMSNLVDSIVCRVISLRDSKQRREYSALQLAKLNLNWEFLDAVDGRLATTFPPEYDNKKRIKHYLFPMSMCEIACFLSHRKAWGECVKLGKTMLIFEDDVYFKEGISEALGIALEKCQWDVFRLYGNDLYEICKIKYFGDFIVYRNLVDPGGAAAYMVTPSGAQKLLNHSHRFFKAVDDYMEDRWVHKAKIKSIFPFPVGVLEHVPSTMNDRVSRKQKSIPQKIVKEFFRAYAGFRRYLYRQYLRIK